jgi:signal peptidase I
VQVQRQVGLAGDMKAQVASLVQQRLADGLEMRFQIVSGSMEPLLQSGDWVSVRGTPLSELRRGDLVCAVRNDHPVIHRVLGRVGAGEGARLLTRGDSSSRSDEPWGAGDVLGRVVLARTAGRALDFERALWRWTNRLCGRCLALRTHLTEGATQDDSRQVTDWGPFGRTLSRLVNYSCRRWLGLAIRVF